MGSLVGARLQATIGGSGRRRGRPEAGILVATLFLAVLAGYLLGSCPTSVPISRRLYGSDIRGHGSGNPGATNVVRTFGWRPGLAVLALDAAKGFTPALLASRLAGDGPVPAATLGLAAGAAATVGHCYPLFAGFRGGKGVATAAGAFLATHPGAVAGGLAVFAALLQLSRYVSAASIGAAAAMPAILLAFRYRPDPAASPADVWLAAALAGFIVFTHRSNLARLRQGREPRCLRPGTARTPGGSVGRPGEPSSDDAGDDGRDRSRGRGTARTPGGSVGRPGEPSGDDGRARVGAGRGRGAGPEARADETIGGGRT